jgi:hypothetical protein
MIALSVGKVETISPVCQFEILIVLSEEPVAIKWVPSVDNFIA